MSEMCERENMAPYFSGKKLYGDDFSESKANFSIFCASSSISDGKEL
jgi:hypothetical protein